MRLRFEPSAGPRVSLAKSVLLEAAMSLPTRSEMSRDERHAYEALKAAFNLLDDARFISAESWQRLTHDTRGEFRPAEITAEAAS